MAESKSQGSGPGWVFWLVITLFVLSVLPFLLKPSDAYNFFKDWQAWYGVIVGFVALATLTSWQLSKGRKQENERLDDERKGLARALYIETYNRLSRTAHDTITWHALFEEEVGNPGRVHVSRFRKFRPTDPWTFASSADRVAALLSPNVAASAAMFFFRLDAIRRDVDKDPELDKHHRLQTYEVALFTKRLSEALKPGMDCLKTLSDDFPDLRDASEALAEAHAQFLKRDPDQEKPSAAGVAQEALRKSEKVNQAVQSYLDKNS